MKKYLVIGNPIVHSLSPIIHNYWMKKYGLMDYKYQKRKIEEKDLENVIKEIKNDEITGINVTVPFKKKIIPFLDELSPDAKKLQSVNTIKKINNKICGYNTDWMGFSDTIEKIYHDKNPIKSSLKDKKILILGAGGATPAILYSLQKYNGEIFITNRTKEKANQLKTQYPQIEILNWGKRPKICDVVINTTSVGLNSDEKINLNFDDCKNEETLFYDLIYNPRETNFLKEARLRGNKTMNGQMMLINQAKYSFSLWTKINPEIDSQLIKLLEK
jgi:shikimate dehydrogenase